MRLFRLPVILLLLLISTIGYCQDRYHDSLSLAAIYRATDGAHWIKKTNWLTARIDRWYGVTLNAEKRVYKVSLPNNGLTGIIPDSIGKLDALWWLDLSSNNLRGAVPDTLGSLRYLSIIDLSGNNLKGGVPASFSRLTDLKSLILDNNFLDGDLANLTGLSNLQYLSVVNNYLTFDELIASGLSPSSIDVFQYSPQDTVLAVDSTILTGMLSVRIGSDKTNIYKWYKNGLLIKPTTREIIPPGEGAYSCVVINSQFTGLTLSSKTLNFSYTAQSDSVVLVSLYASTRGNSWTNKTNWLTGRVSTWYGITVDAGGRVIKINLENNNLDGTLPAEVGNLSKLQSLKVGGNKLRGALPNCTGMPIDSIWVAHNRYIFDNLELLGVVPGDIVSMNYQPQDTTVTLSYNPYGGLLTANGGSDINNIYKWYLNTLLTGDTTQSIVIDEEGSYNCVIHNSVYTALTFNTTSQSVVFNTVSDSLALVSLYNETNGSAWTNRTNWLKGPLSGWYGISLDANRRVQKILLPHNKLAGNLPVQICRLSHLTQLDLSNNQLTGIIPTQIDKLKGLTVLRLFSNDFSGNIPTGIDQLVKLEELGLHSNQLTGVIPTGIVNLIKLKSLKLANNHLTGTIPTGISGLTQLEWIALNDNQLTGTIPAGTGSLLQLTGLELDGNQFTGSIPSQLGNLTGLIHLSLDDNNLSGTIPSVLGNCTHLNYLSLSGNQLTGTIPVQITNLTELTDLLLGGNQLTGSIPTGIGNLTSLNNLGLEKNRFSGVLPSSFSNLVGLVTLKLDSNHFRGNIPSVAGADYLSELTTEYNRFTFTNLVASSVVPGDLNQYSYSPQDTIYGFKFDLGASSLEVLDDAQKGNQFKWYRDTVQLTQTTQTIKLTLEGNYYCKVTNPQFPLLTINSDTFLYSYTLLTDSVSLVALYDSTNGSGWSNKSNWLTGPLSSWYGVTLSGGRVTKLILNNNNLTGTLPPEFGKLANLSVLQLQGNNLSGSMPSEMGEIDSLTDLRLNNNQLTGSIPSTLGNLSKLKTLYLNNNQFTNTIPTELGKLSELSYLALQSNKLTGPIPASIGNLTKLQTLNLNMNQLSGGLPENIGGLIALQYLYVSNNLLTGIIPSGIVNLTSIRTINLSGNGFTGSLPEGMDIMGNLRILNLTGNKLSGNLPESLGYLSSLQEFYIGGNAFHFRDIEPIFSWDNYSGIQSHFTYSPQARIGKTETLYGYQKNKMTVGIDGYIKGAHDAFKWYKNGTLLSGKSDSVLVITSFADSDAGVYYCVVTNSVATSLNLMSDSITVMTRTVPATQALTGITKPSGSMACYDATQDITVAGDGTAVSLESGSSVEVIAGRSIRFLPGFHAYQGSYAYAHITTTGTFCESAEGSIVYSTPAEKSISDAALSDILSGDGKEKMVYIYPNPNNGNFTISFKNLDVRADIRVFNTLGALIYHSAFDGADQQKINLTGTKKGLYIIKVTDGNKQFTKKMIVE